MHFVGLFSLQVIITWWKVESIRWMLTNFPLAVSERPLRSSLCTLILCFFPPRTTDDTSSHSPRLLHLHLTLQKSACEFPPSEDFFPHYRYRNFPFSCSLFNDYSEWWEFDDTALCSTPVTLDTREVRASPVRWFLASRLLTLWRRNFLLNFSTPCI